MRKYNSVSGYPSVVKEKFPFWVLPTSLLFFLIGFFIFNFMRVNHVFEKKAMNFIENDLSRNPSSSNIGYSNAYERYQLGVNTFSKRDYEQAGIIFENLYKERRLPLNLSTKISLYYAYSLLFNSQIYDDRNLMQDSKDLFANLFIKSNQNTNFAFFVRVLLGYVKSSRYLDQYPSDVDMPLKQASFKVNEKIKRQIFLELGYFYASSNNYNDALVYFLRAALPVSMLSFYQKVFENDNTHTLLVGLIKNNLIPQDVYNQIIENIKQKFFKEAIGQFNYRNITQAKKILLDVVNLFAYNDSATEDAYYLLGYYSQFENNTRDAIQYYYKVLKNQNTRRDSAALYQIALLNLNSGRSDKASQYFTTVIKSSPYSVYASESYKWLRDIQAGISTSNGDNGENFYAKDILPSISYNINSFSTRPKAPRRKETKPAANPIINLNVQNEISGSNNQSKSSSTLPPVANNSAKQRELDDLHQREKDLKEEMQKLRLENQYKERLEEMKRQKDAELRSRLAAQKSKLESMRSRKIDEDAQRKIEQQERELEKLKDELAKEREEKNQRQNEKANLESQIERDEQELERIKEQQQAREQSLKDQAARDQQALRDQQAQREQELRDQQARREQELRDRQSNKPAPSPPQKTVTPPPPLKTENPDDNGYIENDFDDVFGSDSVESDILDKFSDQ
jgi:TolA-binding protein